MKSKKRKNRLAARTRDYQSMLQAGSKESKVQQRMDSGGYKQPGSYNK